MVINTTQWSPDTCGCVFEYTWDTNQSEDTRIHTFSRVVKECASHAHLTGNNKRDMYDSSLEENRRKNFTVKELMDRATSDFYDVNAQDGSLTLKNGIEITWSWTGTAPDRVMNLNLSGKTLTENRINQIQAFIDNRFGVGKVIFTNNNDN